MRTPPALVAALCLLAPATQAATFTVTHAGDDGTGSLRHAITQANATDAHDTIVFDVGTGFITIALDTPLPTITRPLTIDGSTQPGVGPTPRVRIDGGATASGNLLRLEAPACTTSTCSIRGLMLTGGKSHAVRVVSGNWTLRGNRIGTDGSAALPNNGNGIHVDAGGHVIGGTGIDDANVIAGNTGVGIHLAGSGSVVLGNRIGTSSGGSLAIPNGSHGIRVPGSNLSIGGAATGEGNLISGNGASGIHLDGVSSNIGIFGNRIGTDLDGSVALPNGDRGISVAGTGHQIGMAGNGNLVSGNLGPGIMLVNGTHGVRVHGNRIGTDAAGAAALGNGAGGMSVASAGDLEIGGALAGQGNLISGNSGRGMSLSGSLGADVRIVGNRIGSNADGTLAIPNQSDGLHTSAVGGMRIGGGNAGEGNLLSGNAGAGLVVGAGSAQTVVQGNRIGTDATGKAALGNNGFGIRVVHGTDATLGGLLAGQGNVISGNGATQLAIDGSVDGLAVLGNRIGVDTDGAMAVPGAAGGVSISGRKVVFASNVVSGNPDGGVLISGGLAEDISLFGNRIGTNAAGTAAIPNGTTGLRILQARNVVVGSSAPGEGNLISGNLLRNMTLEAGVDGAIVEGNRVGPDQAGTAALSPASSGVTLRGRNIILRNNQVSGNGEGGIAISGADAHDITLVGNRIGTDAAGAVALPGGIGIRAVAGSGITIGGDAAADANLVSGNTFSNIRLEAGVDGAVVAGNRIGPDLAGTLAISPDAGGIDVGGRNIFVRNNQISGNAHGGIAIAGEDAEDIVIAGNRIGTDPGGTTAVPNGGYGIRALSGRNVRIGGLAADEGNLVSGNGRGVAIEHGMIDTWIAGNTIGLNLARNAKLPNGDWSGLDIAGQGTIVGGTTPAAGNVIAGNQGSGIVLWGETGSGTVIQGNAIGTNPAGAALLGNRLAGIQIDRSHASLIGGTGPGEGNLIAHNGFNGILQRSGDGNSFIGNRIRDNGFLGIDIEPQGPQQNDALDADGGPNFAQNHPRITSALATGSQVLVEGLLHSAPQQTYLIEIVHSPACSPTGLGEGHTPLGFLSVDTDAEGNASFSSSLPLNTMAGVVTALATAEDGSTSEYSPCHGLSGPNPGTLQFWRDPFITWEGLPHVDVGVVRSMGNAGTISVQLETLDDSATAPADYSAWSETLTFGDGEVFKSVRIPIVADSIAEGQEQFLVRLGSPSGGATLGAQSQVPVIIIDVGPDFPMYFVDDVTAHEPAHGQRDFVFTVSLTATDQQRIIGYQTEGSSAESGVDFLPVSGQLVFPPSPQTQSRTVAVPVLADAEIEANEVFYLTVAAVGGSPIAEFKGIGIGTIRDADPNEAPRPDQVFRDGFDD